MIKWMIWSLLCIGLGVLLARYPLGGQTAVDRAEKEWGERQVAEKVEDAIHEAKKSLAPAKDAPKETHSKEDRASVDKLLAKRATQ